MFRGAPPMVGCRCHQHTLEGEGPQETPSTLVAGYSVMKHHVLTWTSTAQLEGRESSQWTMHLCKRRRIHFLLLQTHTCMRSKPRKLNVGDASLQDPAPCRSPLQHPSILEPEGFPHRCATLWSLWGPDPT